MNQLFFVKLKFPIFHIIIHNGSRNVLEFFFSLVHQTLKIQEHYIYTWRMWTSVVVLGIRGSTIYLPLFSDVSFYTIS